METRESTLLQTRKQLNAYTFDASIHLESFVSSVAVDSAEPEKKLFALFEKLTKQYTDVSLLVEDDVAVLQNSARQTEKVLLNEMVYNSEKLLEVGDAVDGVKMSFDLASEGAVRIGGKLSSAERERSHIEKSIELLGYIKIFQETPAEKYNIAVKQNSTQKELREGLPAGLQKKNWGTISEVLHDLKKILHESSSEDVKNAQNNIVRLADRVEMELLNEFEKTIIAIISTKHEDSHLIERAKDLAEWLHLFNNGQSIQKRYIFTVVQHRIPNDSFFQSGSFYSESQKPKVTAAPQAASSTMGWLFGSKPAASTKGPANPAPAEEEFSDNESDGMTPGHSSHYPLNKTMSMESGNGGGGGPSLMDHLSGLFGMINTVCQEQFSIIRQVFPAHTIAKVTRMLIQRIFNDPAFGIQARVDSILCPAPPQPPLSLPDYLDALVIVREKLSALFLLLIECCSHPSMRGMGSESACLKKAKQPTPYGRTRRSNRDEEDGGDGGPTRRGSVRTNNRAAAGGEGAGGGGSLGNMFMDADEEAEEILHSEAEIRDFFDDQIGQVFSTYLTDYFAKESLHVRNQLTELLRGAVEDPAGLTKPSSTGAVQLPLMRADRIKSIQSIVQTVGNKVFLNRIFTVATDAVGRMESIGRDDKKLTHRLKDLFLLEVGFLTDGLFLPWSKACVLVLLKQLASRSSANALPPPEILSVLAVVTYGVSRIKSHFEEVYHRPLAVVPNIVAVCKETRMKAFKELDLMARQMLYAWTLCAVAQVEKVLSSLQSRYDYAPKFDTSGAAKLEPTTACDTACKTLQAIVSTVRAYEAKLLGLDLVKVFWRPLGQQVIGVLITHLRKQKISPDGCKFLNRDIKEYTRNLTFTEAPDIIDMMACLKELSGVLSCAPNLVVKMVVEDLRYVDSAVVLAFVKARSDSASRDPNHFATHLATLFPTYKSDVPLSWENRKLVTQSVLTEAAAQGSKWTATLGPTSLRRTAGSGMNPVSALYMAEVVRASTLTPAQLTANGRTVAVDLSRIDEEDDIDSIPVRALSVSQNTPSNRMSTNFASSQFLPNRPDDHLSGTAPAATQASANSLSSAAKAGGGIARPDHLITGTGAASGAGAAPGGVNGKARPHSTVIKSSAATLLSAGSSNPAGADAAARDKRTSMPVPRKSVEGGGAGGEAGLPPPPPQAQTKKLLNKMASFFQR